MTTGAFKAEATLRAATPAVGGKVLKLIPRLLERADSYISENGRDDAYSCNLINDLASILRSVAASPASPLQGFTEQELAVIQELSEYYQVSQIQTLRQALRFYQLHEKRIRDGETFAWSGDKARAEEFAALAVPAFPLRGRDWNLAIEEAARCVDIHAQEMRNCSLTLTPDGLSAIAKAIRAFATSLSEQPQKETK